MRAFKARIRAKEQEYLALLGLLCRVSGETKSL